MQQQLGYLCVPWYAGLGGDVESSLGQRHSPGRGGFEAKVAADELSSRQVCSYQAEYEPVSIN